MAAEYESVGQEGYIRQLPQHPVEHLQRVVGDLQGFREIETELLRVEVRTYIGPGSAPDSAEIRRSSKFINPGQPFITYAMFDTGINEPGDILATEWVNEALQNG